MIRTNIYLPEVQRERLQRLGAQTGLSESELIRRAIDRFLEVEEAKQAKQAATHQAGK